MTLSLPALRSALAACESASEGHEGLDDLIEAACGLVPENFEKGRETPGWFHWKNNREFKHHYSRPYTTSLNDSEALRRELLPDIDISSGFCAGAGRSGWAAIGPYYTSSKWFANTEPLARTTAILRALIAQKEGE